MTAACALALGAGPAGAADQATPKALAPGEMETALVAEMNRVRGVRGRPPLRVATTLRRAARGQSRYLVKAGVLDHDSADGSPFWTRFLAAGFPRDRYMAENLAQLYGCDAGSARRTVTMWMASPGHRANLLSPRYRWVGAGSASVSGCASTVLTVDFGS